MPKLENPELMHDKMVLIANLYYREKLSQAEIAKRLGISRPWVSRLLAKAEEMGIVQIKINAPVSGVISLGEQLQERFGLQFAAVVENTGESRDYVAAAAVNYFISKVKMDDVIGIGWGDTIFRFLQEVPKMQWPQVKIVPLSGSFGVTAETLPNYVAIRLADLLGGTAVPLHAPAFCASEEEYETIVRTEAVRSVLLQAETADIAVVGMGSFESSFLIRNEILSAEELKQLQDSRAVGDIALQYLNDEGKAIDNELCRRIIRADLFKLREHAREVIGIAQGKEKLPVIKAVLMSHLVTSFITDRETALELLT